MKRRFVRMALVACVVLVSMIVMPAVAQIGSPYVYRGQVGDHPVDVVLQTLENGGIGGYWFDRVERVSVPLEKSPYRPDRPMLINLLPDKSDGALPFASLALAPMTLGDETVSGRWVDLRTRQERLISLRRFAHLLLDQQGEFDTHIVLPLNDAHFYFEAHVRKTRGEYAGGMYRIVVHDVRDGAVVQNLEVDAPFYWGETVHFTDFNGDGYVDFYLEHAQGRQHYLYMAADGAYRRFAPLDDLARSGTLRYGRRAKEPVLHRPESGVDYGSRMERWDIYRFSGPERIEKVGSLDTEFGTL